VAEVQGSLKASLWERDPVMASQTPISSRMVDWFLYNLPMLKEKVEESVPGATCMVTVVWARTNNTESKIERYAIKRAAVQSLIDVIEKGIKSLHPDQRKIYRLKYRRGFARSDIKKRLYLSSRTIDRRLAEIREALALYLQGVPESDMNEFWRILGND